MEEGLLRGSGRVAGSCAVRSRPKSGVCSIRSCAFGFARVPGRALAHRSRRWVRGSCRCVGVPQCLEWPAGFAAFTPSAPTRVLGSTFQLRSFLLPETLHSVNRLRPRRGVGSERGLGSSRTLARSANPAWSRATPRKLWPKANAQPGAQPQDGVARRRVSFGRRPTRSQERNPMNGAVRRRVSFGRRPTRG